MQEIVTWLEQRSQYLNADRELVALDCLVNSVERNSQANTNLQI
jgi:hypothetical protein